MSTERFYITTPIFYPNGVPHIGHAYTAIATDVLARFQRLDGKDVFFLSGTDEHGQKMQQTAEKEGIKPIELADKNSAVFRDMLSQLNCSNDDFIRTTEERHKHSVQELWKRMEANGDIYLGNYGGWYSVRQEAYFDQAETTVGEDGVRREPLGSPVEWVEEESYYFKLSAYEDKLLELYETNPEFVAPSERRNEVASFVKSGLRDLSISRTTFDWGVPVPGNDKHVMYVWVDALTNYITAAGFPDEAGDKWNYWPAVHMIGKDIVRFHAVYWPAFLMSAGLALPEKVFAHGFLLVKGEKMSKSLGNVVDPLELAGHFGVDPLRYFLLREVSFGQDGSYSAEAIVTRCNAELANSFGNLAQRVLSMIFKNCDGALCADLETSAADRELESTVRSNITNMQQSFETFAFSEGLESWMRGVFACNQYVDEQAPWGLKKTDPQRMTAVLMTLFRCIRDLAIAVRPVVPSSIDGLLDQMGIAESSRNFAALEEPDWFGSLAGSGFILSKPEGVFPRLEVPESADADEA